MTKKTSEIARKGITLEHKGQFQKGMIMEWLENAAIHYFLYQQGLQAEQRTHTFSKKKKKKADYSKEQAKWLWSNLQQHIWDNGLAENIEQVENMSHQEIATHLTIFGKDVRTVRKNLDLLITHGFVAKRLDFRDFR